MRLLTPTIRIFISSSFKDLTEERNALQKNVFPKLRELCELHGARFQPVDLRWGVSDEAAVDQQTMKICLDEIKRCQKITPKPNFVILLGDRYGWCPLPAEIPATEFAQILTNLPPESSFEEKQRLLEKWYKIDENATPPMYCLIPRKGSYENYEQWAPIEQTLHLLLEKTAFQLVKSGVWSKQQLVKYVASATEQEMMEGAVNVNDAQEHVFCFFRTIKNLPADQTAKDYLDFDIAKNSILDEAKQRLDGLKSRLQTQLTDNVHEYTAYWTGTGITTNHIDQLCSDVYECLSRIIHDQLEGMESTDKLKQEIQFHELFGEERSKVFVGRTAILSKISEYIQEKTRKPLGIYGLSGSGKSALMAKAKSDIQASHPSAVVISRFIGATASSSSGRALLEGICRQLAREYKDDETAVPTDYAGLISEFEGKLKYATAEIPLVILLDALDQLSDEDNAHNLKWIPEKLPKNVFLIVSTLPGKCKDALEKKEATLIELEPLKASEGEELLSLWLHDAGRTLKEPQRREVLTKFVNSGLPLYLRLAFEEAKRWHSYTTDITINPTIQGIISDLFNILSDLANHGEVLVSHSLSYLLSARYGLAEDEIIAVLSADAEVMSDYRARCPLSPSVDSLPPIIWSRLYFDLEPYLTEHATSGNLVLSFFHNIFREAVKNNYLGENRRKKYHRLLSQYFLDQKNEFGPKEKIVYNTRKLSELPYQLLNAEQWTELTKTLSDLSFINAKCKAGMVYDLNTDYGKTLETPNVPSENRDEISEFAQLIKMNTHILADYSNMSIQLAYNAPDCTAPARSATAYAKEHPQNVPSLMRWVNKIQIPSLCMYTLDGHEEPVWACDISNDGKTILSCSADRTLKTWDATNGKEIMTYEGHKDAIEMCKFSPQNDKIISADRSGQIIIWNTVTGNKDSRYDSGKNVEAQFDSTNDRVVVAGKGNMLTVWDISKLSKPKRVHQLRGHNRPVNACCFSPDGKRIASAGEEGEIKLWDPETGKLIETSSTKHESAVWRLKYFKDGKTIVSASEDGKLKLWNSTNLQEQGELTGTESEPIWAIDVSPNGEWIISGSQDNTLKLWSVKEKCKTFDFGGHADEVWGCRFFPNGMQAISASWDRTLRVWDINSAIKVGEKQSDSGNRLPAGHSGKVLCSAFSPDDAIVVSGSWDGWIRIWDSETGFEIKSFKACNGYVTSLSFSRNGKWLIVGSDDGELKLFDPTNGSEASSVQAHTAQVCSIAVSGNGTHIMSSSRDGFLHIWDISNNKLELRRELGGKKKRLESCAFSGDGQLAVAGTEKGTIQTWDVDTQEQGKLIRAHTASVLWCMFYPRGDSRILLSASADETLKLWDLSKPNLVAKYVGHTSGVQTGSFSQDGVRIVSSSWDKSLRIWDTNTGQTLCTMIGHSNELQDGRFSSTGKRVVSGSLDGTIRLWDSQDGTPIGMLAEPTNWTKNVLFSAYGRHILTCSHRWALRVWSGTTGTLLHSLGGHCGDVRACAFSPDGSKVLSASADKTLKVWDSSTGALLETLSEHEGPIQSCAFSPDGETIASASWDKTVRLWNAETYEQLAILKGHSDIVQEIAFLSDGVRLLSRSADKSIQIWDIRTKKPLFILTAPATIQCLALSSEGNKVIYGYQDKFVAWNIEEYSDPQVFSGHNGKILCCCCSPDGSKAVSGSEDARLRLWNVYNPNGQSLALKGHSGPVLSCQFSPDGTKLVSGSLDSTLRVWDIDGSLRNEYWVGSPVRSVAWHPKGKLIAAGDDNGNMNLLETK
jgi:NACHT domain- and WD repeat-containing protein